MRSLAELTSTDEPAWPTVQTWLSAATVPVEVLPVTEEARVTCLLRLQVTTRSTLGALAWNTGGICVDHGWIRILGGGHRGLTDLATASGLGEPGSQSTPPDYVLAGYDVLGGQFAVNGGPLPGAPGQVAYYAPDTLEWMSLDMGHSDFVAWAITGDIASFYADLRWTGWEDESAALRLDQGISVFPPLFSQEAKNNLAAASRAPVPMHELLQLNAGLASQLRDVPDGGTFRIEVQNGAPKAPKRFWKR
jgi:hypothetical protein